VFLAVAGGLATWRQLRRARDPAVLLAKAYTAARPFEFRLADSGYGPVRQQRGAGSAFDRPEALDAAVAAIRGEVAAHPRDPAVSELKGRAQLMERDYEGAIESLTRATPGGEGDPDALADLATAYAVRGEAEKRNIDYGHAMELYLRALRRRPDDQRMLFNLALVYEKLWLVDEAIEAWQRFLKQNPAAGWRQEAETHLAAIEKIKADKKKADDGVLREPGRFLAVYGNGRDFDPLPWWEVFWMEWMPKAASDRASADAARIIAEGFRRFGEFSLIESVEAPESEAKNAGLVLLADAMGANRKGHPGDALNTARDAAVKLDDGGLHAAAALALTEFVYATQWAAMNRECRETSERVLRSLGRNRPRLDYPWLEGNAHLEHSACVLHIGDAGLARAEMELAEKQMAKIGLWPAGLHITQAIVTLDGYTGNYGAVWDTAPDALRRYWGTAASLYRAQAFQYALYQASLALAWNESAVAWLRVAARFAHAAGNHEIEASDRSRLAQLLHEKGDYQAEVRELEEVTRLLDPASHALDVRHLHWEAALRRVEADIATNPSADRISDLERLAADTAGRSTEQQMELEQARGLAFLGRKNTRDASAAFSRTIRLNQALAQSARTWVDRIPLMESSAPAYRELTQIQLRDDNNPSTALATWLQFRSLSAVAPRSVAMAALPGGIAIWTVNGKAIKARWADVSAVRLRRISEEFLGLCASPSSDPREIRRLGNQLYRALLAPELTELGPGTIPIVADSWLSAIPFGALTDDSGEYLFRQYHFVDATGPGRDTAAKPIIPGSRALIVAAPAAVAPGQPRLPFLQAADREAGEVASRFFNAAVQRDATPEWLEANAPGVNVFHFSGHGWANGGDGALILPPGPDGAPHFITSRNLARQNWSHCELAVLSACLTAAGETRGIVNNRSLVQALLSAGARRVVAAMWSVDSEATRALMDGFYARLVSGKSVPDSLSGAAADVAASPGWSLPYFWAGFEVFGSA
jgi:CHAT domain-containing protein